MTLIKKADFYSFIEDAYFAGISEQQAGINALDAVGIEGSYITGTGIDGEDCRYVYICDPDGNYYAHIGTGNYCTPA